MTKVYNRKLKRIEEVKHFGGNTLKKVYRNKLLTRIATSKFISKVYGIYNSSVFSKSKINKFIRENNIDISLYEDKKYKSFNDFFIRKYKDISFSNDFVSPCDSKLLVYRVDSNLKVLVKDIEYSLEELFNDKLEEFKDSYMFIYRLALDDCHRYYYIDDGVLEKKVKIKGRLHTVSDSSSKYKIYKENEREYSILNTKNFGRILYMEVGALLVGRIVDYNKKEFIKGEEKGYFLPGGSTIIIISKDIEVDKDILEYSNKGIETLVKIGERVGKKK